MTSVEAHQQELEHQMWARQKVAHKECKKIIKELRRGVSRDRSNKDTSEATRST